MADKEHDPRRADTPGANTSSERSAKPEDAAPFFVVGVGASAGGLETLETLLAQLDPKAALALVVVTHLDPTRKSLMAELLSRKTPIPVAEAVDGQSVQPGCVYVIPPGKDIAIVRGRLWLQPPATHHGVRHPIDSFFRSLAIDQADNAVGVILSGAGSDGMLGLKEIKGAGGVVMAQEPSTAKYEGMPRSAIATGMVDLVLPVEELPGALADYVRRARGALTPATDAASSRRNDLIDAILAQIRGQLNHDFSNYKRSTIVRRIEKRMLIKSVESCEQYIAMLEKDDAELAILFKNLLIGVTSFFRDPEAFASLADLVIPELFKGKKPGDSVRVWIPGCSTGEEAYSVAILLKEHMEQLRKVFDVQIFATDLDASAVETARSATYPSSIAADVSLQRLKKYFRLHDDLYTLSKPIREMIIFAPHDVLSDPPFCKLDLICCRNLLIYITSATQKRLMPLFYNSLVPGGYLFLGPSESLGVSAELFSTLDKKWRIFKRGLLETRASVELHVKPRCFYFDTPRHYPETAHKRVSPAAVLDRQLLKRFGRPSVLIDASMDILYYSGDTSEVFVYPEGEPSSHLIKNARRGIKLRLRTIVHKAISSGKPVTATGLKVQGVAGEFTIHVDPVEGDEHVKNLYSVIFDKISGTDAAEPSPAPQEERDTEYLRLEDELKITGQQLQDTVEELESANEELKSSNEELMSMNEELQSSNEELETSKEELQALNEELVTVNAELSSKVTELQNANNDIENLLASSNVATVFVDKKMAIRRYTPTACDIFHLIASDLGRSLEHVVNRLEYPELIQDCRAVLESEDSREREIQSEGDGRYIARLFQYRTMDGDVDGVVLTFIDITQRHKAEEALRISQERYALALEATGTGVYDYRLPFDEHSYHTEQFANILGYTHEELPGHKEFIDWLYERMHKDDRAGAFRAHEVFHSGKDTFFELEVRLRHKEGHFVWVRAVAKPVDLRADGSVARVVGVMMDVTESKEVEIVLERRVQERTRELYERQALLSAVMESYPGGMVSVFDRQYRWVFNQGKGVKEAGFEPGWLLGKTLRDAFDPEVAAYLTPYYNRAFAGETVDFYFDFGGKNFVLTASPLETNDSGIEHIIVVARDDTERRQSQMALEQTASRLAEAQRIAKVGDWNWDPDTDIVTWSAELYRIMGLDPTQPPPNYEGQIALYHPDDHAKFRAAVEKAVGHGEPYELEMRRPLANGSELTLLVKGETAPMPDGNRRRLFGSVQDITDRKLVEQKLQDAHQHLLQMLESTTDAFFELDADFTVTYMNAKALKVLFLPSVDSILGSNLWETFPQAVGSTFYTEYQRALNEQVTVEFEEYFEPFDCWFEVHAYPSPSSMSVYFRDITDRKKAEQELIANEQRFRAIFEESGDAILIADDTGRFVDANPATQRLLGYSLEELQSMTTQDRATRELAERFALEWSQFREQGKQSGEYSLQRKDGAVVDVEYRAVANFMPGRHLSVMRDVTERKQHQETLNRALAQAKAASQAKSAFLANMSHEIRTPLNGVMGMLELMKLTGLQPDQAEYADYAIQSSKRLTTLLSDILDLSRVEAGKMTLLQEETDMAELLHSVEHLFGPAASDKGLELTVWSDPALPQSLLGDATRLFQVLSNLVGNAIKFTNNGSVSVQASLLQKHSEGHCQVLFAVTDTGIGISDENMDKLFEPFTQEDVEFTRKDMGAGLGLSIVKSIVQLMQGNLCISSAKGEGTTIFLSMPFRISGQTGQPPRRDLIVDCKSLHDRRVLVAEDDRVSRISLTRFLQMLGCTVATAATGREALEMLREESYDVVLMDVQMPVMNGVEATKAIRQGKAGPDKAKTPIIALTAFAMAQDKEKFLESGMSDYLAKPVELEILRKMLLQTLCSE